MVRVGKDLMWVLWDWFEGRVPLLMKVVGVEGDDAKQPHSILVLCLSLSRTMDWDLSDRV